MPNRRRLHASFIVLALLFVAAPGLATAQELWVLNEGTLEIAIINPSSNSWVTSVDVSDPDGDGTSDVPSAFCFSTLGNDMGTVAFVLQGKWLNMIDVGTRTQINTPWDVSTLAGLPGLTLAACAGAPPTSYDDVGGLVTKTYLHVAANDATGAARSVVLDQDQLLLAVGAPFVESDVLDANAAAVGVSPMPKPSGDDFQRAWYTVERSDALVAVQIATTKMLGPWVISQVNTTPVTPGPPHNPLSNRPPCSEVEIMSQGTLGSFVNLEMGQGCTLGGDIRDLELTGPGPNSMTVLAVDGSANELKVFEPDDCSVVESFGVGMNPVAITTLDKLDWQSAFVVNRDSDNVTRVDRDRTITTIGVAPPTGPSSPLMGLCVQCPVQAEMSMRNKCRADDLRVAKKDLDNDGTADDIELSFVTDCPGPPVFRAVCECLDDPLCPCRCDCGNDPDPGCFCPMPDQLGGGGGSPENHTVGLIPDWPIDEVPWIDLGPTQGLKYKHLDGALPDGSFAYLIVP